MREIRQDVALRCYGAMLAFNHVITAFFWDYSNLAYWLSAEVAPICWPLIPGCHHLHVFSVETMATFVVVYGYMGAAVTVFFVRKSWLQGAVFGLATLELLKVGLMSIDLRTSLNPHTIAFLCSAAFLIFRDRRTAVRLILIYVYFVSGIIKLDPHWLSGDALTSVPDPVEWVPKWVLAWSIVVLEVGLVWGLIARNTLVFLASYASFAAFHILSYWIIGFYFPSTMLLLLGIFPLAHFVGEKFSTPNAILTKQLQVNVPSKALMALIVSLAYLQFLPKFTRKDANLTGYGKFHALHMFDRKVDCRAELKRVNGTEEAIDFNGDRVDLPSRLICHPAAFIGRANRVCETGKHGTTHLAEFDLFVVARLSGEDEFRVLIDLPAFCASGVSYSPVQADGWVLPAE